jgi:hypothetical protein
MWLYQLSTEETSVNNYRLDVWENERWEWPVGQIRGAKDGEAPEAGDIVAFFYTKNAGQDKMGFYGWAVVLHFGEYKKRSFVGFRPVYPSDYLKMDPWGEPNAINLADKIRGSWKQSTLFLVAPELERLLKEGIRRWIYEPRKGVDRE